MTAPSSATGRTEDVRATLGLAGSGARWRAWLWIGLVTAVIVAGAAAYLVLFRPTTPAIEYRTDVVRRGAMTLGVTATGNLEPLMQVNVGTEISGIIESVMVDDNDRVRASQVLARVNTEKLSAQAEQARAALVESRNALARAVQLREAELVSALDFETAQTAVTRAEADEAGRIAAIAQSRATLTAIESDISRAIIRSPISGIVLDRQVDPGQTVAAAFQTPTLFTLAEDLAQMKLSVDVDEADIGRVRTGQPATFTVDAHPDRRFDSKVVGISNVSQTSGGVVTYETLLSVMNPELLLKPGMTATADITVAHTADALLVPNAALRFVPDEVIAAETQPAGEGRGGLFGGLAPRRPGPMPAAGRGQRVWILRDGQPVAVEVTVGATDGSWTEIVSGDLPAGTAVIVDTIARTGR